MNKKRISKILGISLLAITVMTSVSPIAANAAWKQNSTGWWFTEGSSWATGWRQISGVWYYFDNNGYMKTGWVKDKGTWYYLDKSGAMKTGWVKDNGTWYYLDKSGAMKTGWQKVYGVWYYLDKSGAMKTGWVKDNYSWYYLEKDGAMRTGWLEENGKNYYLDEFNGAMKTGFYGRHPLVTYYFDKHGVSANGWTEIGGKMYYFEKQTNEAAGYSEYVMARSRFLDGYYIDNNGVRQDISSLKVKNEEEALALVKENDSDFIAMKEKENADFKVSPNGYAESSRDLFVFGYNQGMIEEAMHIISYGVEASNVKGGFYAVGAVTGKVYCVGDEEMKVYEIKDNKKVGSYELNNKTNTEFNNSDWR